MPIIEILKYPDNRLRKIAKPVLKINKKIQKIINNMFETMYNKNGIGLAATQINIPLQIIVISYIHKSNDPLTLINPEIIKISKTIINTEEGCLSIPNYQRIIPRSSKITITALNRYGQKIKIQASSMLSVCIQHELDHLIGKLIIDYFPDNHI